MSCKNKTCACAQRDFPREEMGDLAALSALGTNGVAALRGLLSVARTGLAGLAKLELPSGELSTLAQTIALLYEERKRLQDLLSFAKPLPGVDTTVSPTDVKIGFGPDKKYTLIIPVTGTIAKQELAAGLRHMAAKLAPNQEPAQLPLPLEY